MDGVSNQSSKKLRLVYLPQLCGSQAEGIFGAPTKL